MVYKTLYDLVCVSSLTLTHTYSFDSRCCNITLLGVPYHTNTYLPHVFVLAIPTA